MIALSQWFGADSLLTRAFRAMAGSGAEFGLSDPLAREFFVGTETTAGVNVNSRTALMYPPWYRAIDLISSDVAKLTIHLYQKRKGGRIQAVDHPAYRILYSTPNEYQTDDVFKKALQFHALQWGNGYAYIERDQNATPLELHLLSPMSTYPIRTTAGVFYVTDIGSESFRFPARDVIHIKGLSFDGLVGYSIIDLMADALGLGIAAAQYGSRFYGQGSNASGILQIPGALDENKMKNVMAAWDKMATGLNRSHRVAVLQNGTTWQQTTIDPQKAQAVETRQFEITVVSNITGIPPHKLALKVNSSYASLEQENAVYLQECLDHHLTRWENELTAKLLTEKQKLKSTHYFAFDRRELLRTDALTRFRVHAIAKQWGFMNTNEIREVEDLDSIGEAGDIYWMPVNMIDASKVNEQTEKVTGDSGSGTADGTKETKVDDGLDTLKARFKNLTKQLKKSLKALGVPVKTDENDAKRIETGTVPTETTIVPEEERDSVSDAARHAHRMAILDRAERMRALEETQVKNAAARGGNFIRWYEGYYAQHAEKMRDAIRPALNAWYVVSDMDGLDAAVEQAVQEYVNFSQSELLECCNGTAEELIENVERLLSGWGNGRIEDLVDLLMGVENV